MLEKIQSSIDTKVPRVGALNLYLSPPSVESIFHLVRSSGKIVENDLCRSFGEYYAHAKYLVLEMRVRDFLWKDDHGWIMINPTLELGDLVELDPWYELNDPGDLDAYLDGLKQKAMRFKFKPIRLLSQMERVSMVSKAFSFNADDDTLIDAFQKEYKRILSLNPLSRKKDAKTEQEIEKGIGNLMELLNEALSTG